MSNTFLYAPMIGGSYAKGSSVPLVKVQTLAGTQFDPKYYAVPVIEYKEDIQVLNKGPQKVFSLIDIDLKNAMQTMSAIIAIAMQNHGQPSGTGVAASRPDDINGWVEALADGVTNTFNGDTYPLYGGVTRNGVTGSAMNSVPYFCGNSDGTTGPITYQILEETYQDCTIGRMEPDLGVTNKAVYSYIKERMQPQQRFAQEKDPVWGVSGFKFNSAMILKDDYFPSLKYGVNDARLGNYLTSTFTSAASGIDSRSNLPTNTLINTGEVFTWFNTKKWAFRVSDDPEHGFGFTGFIPAQDNFRVVGHIKAAVNLECTATRLNKVLYGIGG